MNTMELIPFKTNIQMEEKFLSKMASASGGIAGIVKVPIFLIL
jgi:hypothetical protein